MDNLSIQLLQKSTNVNEITEWMMGRKNDSSSDGKKAAHDELETLWK